MFKMPTGVAALVVAGLACLACTDGSSLKSRGGSGNGGQAGSNTSSIGGQTVPASGGSGTGGQGDCICDFNPGGTSGGQVGSISGGNTGGNTSGVGGQSADTNSVHECQLDADGTCSALTVNTACTPFSGRRYDESAGCYATVQTTLWCCATAAGESCAWPPAIGCVQIVADGGTVAYWTPGLPGSGPLPAGQTCDQSESARVSSSPSCLSTATDAAAPDADGVANPDGSPTRIPLLHRPAGSTCPSERAPGPLQCDCEGSDGGCSCRIGECGQDSDCSAGTNGRCLELGPAVYAYCVYDTCFSDSDCPSNQPCNCRASASDYTANTCLTGSNCRVDSDCGPSGYCSPSQVGVLCQCSCNPVVSDGGCYEHAPDGTWTQVPCSCGDCGHGYFCHTPQDTCLNDSDCANGDTCNYDGLSNTWTCSYCSPPP